MALEVPTGAEALRVSVEQLAPGTYFWRVRTVGWVDLGEWSEPWSFTVDFSNSKKQAQAR